MSFQKSLLIIFLKAPRSGFVKTRLAASLGDSHARDIYLQLVESLFKKLKAIRSVELRVAPDDAIEECQIWLQAEWKMKSQGEGDLGERLRRAFFEAFEKGWQRVLAIGSDCPDVSKREIIAANAALKRCPVVLGPARDGGYWLIGTSRFLPHLFSGIEWSSKKVFAQTLKQAHKQGLSVHILNVLEDIDEASDWDRYIKRQN